MVAAKEVCRLIWVVIALSACTTSSYKQRLDEIERLRGTREEMRAELQKKKFYFGKSELTFELSMASHRYCWNKKHGTEKNVLYALDKINVLVEAEAYIDGAPGEYPNPMAYLALCEATDVMDFLLSKGAKIDIRDPVGNTLLHEAVCNKTLTMTKYFHQRGIPLNAWGHFGETPMQAAIKCNNAEAIEYLKNNGVTN